MTDQDSNDVRTECPTVNCGGRMVTVEPIETVRSDEFVLVRIECSVCHASAWRIVAREPDAQ